MREIFIKDGFIKLGQALKLAGCVESGFEAKRVINDGNVLVNGKIETRRGRKLVDDDYVTYHGEIFAIRSRDV